MTAAHPSQGTDAAACEARTGIRITALRTLPGKNFWSRAPVTRLDLAIGAFEEVSSADVPGLVTRLVSVLPGLREHRCSVGRPGGFVERLVRGTYAPHVIEHVALELQQMLGMDVGYGRARGAERPGHYVVAFEHRHAAVGRAAAEQATALVCAAFDGAPLRARTALDALRAASEQPDDPPPDSVIACGVCAPPSIHADVARATSARDDVVAFTPATVVERGLPYHQSDVGVVTSARADDMPPGFRSDDRPDRLLTVVVDGLAGDGLLICPSDATALHAYAGDRGRRVATFEPGADVVAVLRDALEGR